MREAVYEIRVQGELPDHWSEWFDGMTLAVETDGQGRTATLLTGPVRDQTALRGMLNHLWDLNLTVLAFRCLQGMQEVEG